MLLFSGATPAAAGRLALLNRFLPLGVIESSHIIGSLAGAALLLLSQGLARRLDTAYYLTAFILTAGIASSLLKGADYEEAVLLAVLLFVLYRAGATFSRKAALFETRFSPAWIAAVAAAIAASIWLGLFAFKHVEYSHDLWWQFELDAEAPRFLRASVGAATLVLFAAVARLVGAAPHETSNRRTRSCSRPPRSSQPRPRRSRFWSTCATRRCSSMHDRTGVSDVRRSGPHVGGPRRSGRAAGRVRPVSSAISWRRCDDFGGTPVFYKVREDYLHHYADFGLAFVKLGEEARVDLQEVHAGRRRRERSSAR